MSPPSTVSWESLSPTLTVGVDACRPPGMGWSRDGREHACGQWVGHRAAQQVAARQSRAQRVVASQTWELYFLVLSAILCPFASTIQRWWRARANRERTPHPAYVAMVVLRWVYHSKDEDEPLYSRWLQVDLNTWGYSRQPVVAGGRSWPLTRTQEDLTRWVRRSITRFSPVTTYSQDREQSRL